MKKLISSLFFIALSTITLHAIAENSEHVFLNKNKTKKGVITTASGLQYQIITKANGQKPTLSNQVRVHYVGTLINGTEFDNSYKRGDSPTVFPVSAVIKGWQEGLQLMPIGSKFKFYIPSALAYGTTGTGKLIKPNETLVFVVELLGIVGVNDIKPIEIKTTQLEIKAETKPATKATIAKKPETTAIITNTNNESIPTTFAAQINAIISNANNNFENIIGDESTLDEKNAYGTHYATNIDIEGVGKGEKITKYASKKIVYYAKSQSLSKQSAIELVDKVLKQMNKIKLPYTFTENMQYNLATRKLITLDFLDDNKQSVSMDMDIDALANSDKEDSSWQVTIRVSKKLNQNNPYKY